MVTASDDDTARIWDVETGAPLGSLPGKAEVLAVAFSPDGERVVTASDDNTARIFDAVSGAPLEVLRGHQDWAVGGRLQPRRRAGRDRER